MSRDEGYVLADMTPKESIVSYGLIQFHPNHCIEPQIFSYNAFDDWMKLMVDFSINTPWHDWFQRKSQMEKRMIHINPCDSPFWENEHPSFLCQHLTHLSPWFLGYGSRLLSQGPKASRRRKFEGWIWESRACYHMAWFNGEAVISTDARFQLSTPPLPKKRRLYILRYEVLRSGKDRSFKVKLSFLDANLYLRFLSQKLQLNRWKSQEVGPRWFIETLLSEMIHQ